MSFKKVMKLREQEQLKDAYNIASEDLSTAIEIDDSESILYARIALGWVYYDYLEIATERDKRNNILKCISKIAELNLNTEEKYLTTSVAWLLSKYLFKYKKRGIDIRNQYLDRLSDTLKKLHYDIPSESYSVLLSAVESVAENWYNFIEFVDWWNLENLRNEDCDFYRKGGRKYDSLAEKAISQYCKNLIRGKFISTQRGKQQDKEKLQLFLPTLEKWIQEYPEYDYLPYYKSKMHLILEQYDKGKEVLIPFIRENAQEYWVWSHLAKFHDNPGTKIAYLAKSLSLIQEEKRSINIRLSLARELLKVKKYEEAKREVDKAYEIVIGQGYDIKEQLKNYRNSAWYKKTEVIPYDSGIYEEWASGIEQELYSEMDSTKVAVTYVNHEKDILSYVTYEKRRGFFLYKNYIDQAEIGDLLELRIKSIAENGYTEIYTADKIQEDKSEFFREVSSTIKIINDGDYGFIEDIYIPGSVVKKYNLKGGQKIKGRAIVSYDKMKDEWGWRLYKLKEET